MAKRNSIRQPIFVGARHNIRAAMLPHVYLYVMCARNARGLISAPTNELAFFFTQAFAWRAAAERDDVTINWVIALKYGLLSYICLVCCVLRLLT